MVFEILEIVFYCIEIMVDLKILLIIKIGKFVIFEVILDMCI